MYQPHGVPQGHRGPRSRGQVRAAFAAGAAVGAAVVLAAVIAIALVDDPPPAAPPAPSDAAPAVSGSRPVSHAFTSAFAGTWRGPLATADAGWEVQLALPLGADTGSVQYYQHGSIQCTGTVRHLEAGRARLKLDEQTPNCDPNKAGLVRLTPVGRELRHQWYADADDYAEDAPSYDGRLRKVG